MPRLSDTPPLDLDPSALGEITTLLQKIVALLGDVPPLTGRDRIRSTKFPKGGESILPLLAALSDQLGFSVTGHSTATMLARRKVATDLIPLQKLLVVALKKVDDAIFLSNSLSWGSASIHYASLQRTSVKHGTLAEALAPATRFFAERAARGEKRRKAKEAKDAKDAGASGPAETPEGPEAPVDEG